MPKWLTEIGTFEEQKLAKNRWQGYIAFEKPLWIKANRACRA
jgi:hypothetical protein